MRIEEVVIDWNYKDLGMHYVPIWNARIGDDAISFNLIWKVDNTAMAHTEMEARLLRNTANFTL